jgi:hypothetical protein
MASKMTEQRRIEVEASMCAYCEHCGSISVARRDSLGNYFCSADCLNTYHGIDKPIKTYWSTTLGRFVTIPKA